MSIQKATFVIPALLCSMLAMGQQQNTQPQPNASFSKSNTNTGNYSPSQAAQDGMAPLPPPNQNNQNTQASQASQALSPLSNEEIRNLREQLDQTRRATAYKPVRSKPVIRSVSVDLSSGANPPVVRVQPGDVSSVVFLDATGTPWPLAVAPRFNKKFYDIEWLQDSHSIVISALSSYESSSMSVFLQGLSVPVIVKMVTGEPDTKSSKKSNREVDARLDIRVPGRSPKSTVSMQSEGKIALYDSTLQAFLDGIPPSNARKLSIKGGSTGHAQIWQFDGHLFVRTKLDIQTAFDQSLASADGTKVYKMPLTPYVTLSQMGRALTIQLDI